jgi:MoaA/NifB/PqqE/SkfB family radical SAM enzyme
MNPPRFLFLHAASECNLRCLHCHFWTSSTRHDPRRLSVETISEIVGEFASLNPAGKVVICGGEPMLEYDRFVGFCQAARSRGLRVLCATNGYGVRTHEQAADLLARGPHEVTVSLDSHLPEVHDTIRGRVGSYEVACSAVRLLANARRDLGLSGSRVNVMVLLTSDTSDHLRELYRLALVELGADKLKVNALQPSFGVRSGPAPSDDFFASRSQINVEKLRTTLAGCDAEFDLRLNPAWVAQLCGYYADLQGKDLLELGWDREMRTSSQICDCSSRNLVVGLYGEVSHCYAFHAFPPATWTRAGDLEAFWLQNDNRPRMHDCRRLCAVGHSNRCLSATLPRPLSKEERSQHGCLSPSSSRSGSTSPTD